MVSIIDVSESFDTAASTAAVWLTLANPPRWPEVLTDLAEAHIAPTRPSQRRRFHLRQSIARQRREQHDQYLSRAGSQAARAIWSSKAWVPSFADGPNT
jgi:hypothetical protein